ncbi:MAG: tetratricopeptide repeat protein [Planctomycetota bacterium]|jgi:tetratricopeptide (TPR) repeat protein
MSAGQSSLGLLLAAVILGMPLAAQDSLQLMDGRIIIGPKMSRSDAGVTVHFENGDVTVPKNLIRLSTVGGQEDKEVQWTEAEQAKIDKGMVLFEGRWMSSKVRDSTMDKRRKARAKKIEEALAHRKWVNRYKTSTSHFAFEYTIDPEIMEDLMEMMEVYYKTFTSEWGIRKPRGMGKLPVKFYHDQEYFYQVSEAGPGVGGYFRFVEPIELHFYFDRNDREMTEDVMFHEANHYLTHLIDPKFVFPRWVDESLAEYYGASDWDPVKKKMITGKLQEGRLAAIQDMIKQDKWQGLEELIRLSQAQFNANHYAWGWSFVHFLLSNKKYEKRFKKFYMALAKDKSIKRKPYFRDFMEVGPEEQIKALKKYLKVRDLQALEMEWHAYVRQLEQSSPRGYQKAGRIALAYGMPIKARRLLNESIKMGSDSSLTYLYLSQALVRKRNYKEAIASLKKLLELDPLNAMGYLGLAECLEMQSGSREYNAESTRLRKLALEIEPDNYSILLELANRDQLSVRQDK